MNKQELIELAKTLGDKAAPQLRTYVYIDWAGWLLVMLCGALALWLIWRFREKINDAVDEPAAHFALVLGGFVYAILLLCFVPYTLHVFTTPELEAIKALLGSS